MVNGGVQPWWSRAQEVRSEEARALFAFGASSFGGGGWAKLTDGEREKFYKREIEREISTWKKGLDRGELGQGHGWWPDHEDSNGGCPATVGV